MDAWDMIIVAAAAYVAVVSLVRLMAHRQDEMLNEVRQQVAKELGMTPGEKENDKERGAA